MVVDLASGGWRRLNDHPSTKSADLQVLPIVEGRAFVVKQQHDENNGSVKVAANMGSDGSDKCYWRIAVLLPLLVGELLAYLQKGS